MNWIPNEELLQLFRFFFSFRVARRYLQYFSIRIAAVHSATRCSWRRKSCVQYPGVNKSGCGQRDTFPMLLFYFFQQLPFFLSYRLISSHDDDMDGDCRPVRHWESIKCAVQSSSTDWLVGHMVEDRRLCGVDAKIAVEVQDLGVSVSLTQEVLCGLRLELEVREEKVVLAMIHSWTKIGEWIGRYEL